MSNLAKKLRDEEDKKKLKQLTGKMPKHRCPVCHRFSLWINNDKGKNQCLMCKLIKEDKEKEND